MFRYPGGSNGNILISPAIRKGLVINPGTSRESGSSASAGATYLSFIHRGTIGSIPSVSFERGVEGFANVETMASVSSFVVHFTRSGFVSLTNVGSPNLSTTPTVTRRTRGVLHRDNLRLRRGRDFISRERRVEFGRLSSRGGGRLVGGSPTCNEIVYHYRAVARNRVVTTLGSPVPPISLSNVGHHTNAKVNEYRNNFYNPGILRVITGCGGRPFRSILRSSANDCVLANRAGYKNTGWYVVL